MTLKNQDWTMFETKILNNKTNEIGLLLYTLDNTFADKDINWYFWYLFSNLKNQLKSNSKATLCHFIDFSNYQSLHKSDRWYILSNRRGLFLKFLWIKRHRQSTYESQRTYGAVSLFIQNQ